MTDVLGVVHYLRLKRRNISENGTVCVLRWKVERERESTLMNHLEHGCPTLFLTKGQNHYCEPFCGPHF